MEVAGGIHQVDGVKANCYVVEGPELMLVDTGLPGNAGKILDYVKNTLSREPADVKTIVLTHHHMDHIGNLRELKRITNAKVAAHRDDVDYIAGRRTPLDPRNVSLKFRIMRLFMKPGYAETDVVLKENDIVGGYTVVHVPGHTPGSICLMSPDRKVLFVGDTLRYQNGKMEGPPPQFTLDLVEAIRSIGKIAGLKFDTMLSGHGDPLKPNASDVVREFVRSVRYEVNLPF